MNKNEAMVWLAAQAPIVAVGIPKKLHDMAFFNDTLYLVNVKKIKPVTLDCVRYENIEFIVHNEGLPDEACYFYKNNTIAWDNEHENPV
jgi:hypothetical protein